MNGNSISWRGRELTTVQRYVVRRLHPRRILIDMAALPWSVYLLWQHDWPLSLLVALASAGLGMLATSTVDTEKYARTIMGRIALLHLHPANIAVQGIGIVAMLWTIWAHSATGILGSLSVIFLGHLAGWDPVLAAPSAPVAEEEAA